MITRSLLNPAWAMLLLALLPVVAFAQEHKKKHGGGGHHGGSPAELNRQFLDPNLDVNAFVKRFEGSEREIAIHRDALLRLADVKPGQAVADIGAGTGLFTWPFAKAVGPNGRVYPVDIAPAFVKYLGDEARKRGLASVVRPVQGGSTTTNLAEGSIDVAFVCATYHHFEKPEAMLASIHKALRPGGRFVLIDWDLRPDSTEHVKQRARAPRDVYFKEFAKAGFTLDATPAAPKLQDNFVAVFHKAP